MNEAYRTQLLDEFKARLAITVQKEMCDQQERPQFEHRIKILSREKLETLALVLYLERQQLADAVLNQK